MNLSRIFVPPILIILLVFSAYSVMELANRISAMNFVVNELSLARTNVAGLVDGNGNTMTPNVVLAIKTEENVLRRSLQQLETLEFSGASDTNTTVYLLMQDLFRQRQASTNRALINDVQRSVAELEQEQNLIDTGLEALQGFLNSGVSQIPSQMQSQIRAASSQIPVIQEPRNPTESILRGVDLQLLSMVREIEGNGDENLRDRYGSLAESIAGAVDRLETRREEIPELISSANAQASQILASSADSPGEYRLPSWATYIGPLFFLSTLPSDLVLILAVVSAAGVGALFVGIHKTTSDLFSIITKGLIAGFVALLVIKGGAIFFTVDNEVALDNSNPFSAAFLGVIAGLFTDKAFNALERVVRDSLEDQDMDRKTISDSKSDRDQVGDADRGSSEGMPPSDHSKINQNSISSRA